MTTIAYRDGVLAADTLELASGCSVIGYGRKIWRLEDGTLVASIGEAPMGDAVKHWLEHGQEGEAPTMAGEAMVIFPDGHMEAFSGENRQRNYPTAPFYAWGSGADVALGAMHMGATAVQAVEAAIRWNVHTGGEITVLRR